MTNDRCYCSDYAFPLPNNYRVTVTIPCWVTDIEIEARAGERYHFIWDNESKWSYGDGTEADAMLLRLLGKARFIDEAGFELDPTGGEPDFDMIV